MITPVRGIVEIRISTTWDGAPLPPDEHVSLLLDRRGDQLRIRVDAPYHGDPPPLGPPRTTDGLWEHEVVELFLSGAEERIAVRYLEIEMSPHGHHLTLAFDGLRRRSGPPLTIEHRARIDGSRWQGEALVALALLPLGPHRLGAFAIHGPAGERDHLSLVASTGPSPDFHDPAVWAPADLGPLLGP